jgi:CRISPR-associated endonuclease/helicase Cas3
VSDDILIAHVKKNEDGSWASPQSVSDHLSGTAALASKYAASFESSSWAYAAGIGHDTGKSSLAWQNYIKTVSGYDEEAHLETKTGKQDHSTPSAKLAEEVLGKGIGRILSYCDRMRWIRNVHCT